MPQDNCKLDEIKRKLRELKKLEMKIYSNRYGVRKDSKISNLKLEHNELVWNNFFETKNESSKKERTKHAKYTIMELSNMPKDKFKEVISEYFYFVYCCYYKEIDLTNSSMFDTDFLAQLGLSIYADHEEIKRKFRELAKTYHPDNGGDSSKFIEIMEQYKNYKG